MRPTKPGKTSPYDVPANIHDWLPFPLVHVAPPPAGFDHNPLSNRFVRDVTRQPPQFESHPVRLTLPREAGIKNDILFAMKGSSQWIFQGKVYNGKANKSIDTLSSNSDLSHHSCGPTRRHEWTKSWLCNCAGKPSTRTSSSVAAHKRMSGGSVRCQCHAKFYIWKTLNGDLKFEWYWRIVPEALNIDRIRVQNRIRRLAKKTKYLDSSGLTSLSLWCHRLQDHGWHVLNSTDPSNQRLSIAFFSPWQSSQLKLHGDDVLCFDSTHNVCSGIPEWPLSKLTLLTLVLRHPNTSSGIPVVWFLTSDEKVHV
ncbi:hypothetical protein DFH28DRAFT_1083610 [Melampsora americana]|nr:hypothetical protein DFH28DRAFT_1083610 [Melampsora americana]